MTPAARIAAAVDLLDRIGAGQPAEQALTAWGRASRFAGSGDRAAVRDLVFDALRCRRSFAALGGGDPARSGDDGRGDWPGGRALMLGALRAAGLSPDTIFTGAGHAPAPLSPAEAAALAAAPAPESLPGPVALDCPDWLVPELQASLGAEFAPVMQLLRQRAPVFLRANLARTTRAALAGELAGEGIVTRPHPLAATALEVLENAPRLRRSAAYREGRVELQDAASQAVAEALPLPEGGRVLDYCAGGGGKTLAMAARGRARWFAHDAAPQRMRDLGPRAERAGVTVRQLATAAVAGQGPYDLVLLDVPCSGSGSWRRAPEAKWTFGPERLAELGRIQAGILEATCDLVAPGGRLAYVTCSLLDAENGARVAAFRAARPGWRLEAERRWTPLDGGDGFYLALLTRDQAVRKTAGQGGR